MSDRDLIERVRQKTRDRWGVEVPDPLSEIPETSPSPPPPSSFVMGPSISVSEDTSQITLSLDSHGVPEDLSECTAHLEIIIEGHPPVRVRVPIPILTIGVPVKQSCCVRFDVPDLQPGSYDAHISIEKKGFIVYRLRFTLNVFGGME